MAEQAPEHQDRGLFGLFGNKKEEKEGTQNVQNMHPPAAQTHNQSQSQSQAEAAAYYPSPPQHGADHCQGQVTSEEAKQQKHTGLMGKLRPSHGSGSGSGSSSSSDEEEEGEKKGGRKKKGQKGKLPGGRNSSDQCGREGEYGNQGVEKEGMMDKIKDKLPGHRNANE